VAEPPWFFTGVKGSSTSMVTANRAQMIPMFTLSEYRFFTVAEDTA
jgi:hypothetical protein